MVGGNCTETKSHKCILNIFAATPPTPALIGSQEDKPCCCLWSGKLKVILRTILELQTGPVWDNLAFKYSASLKCSSQSQCPEVERKPKSVRWSQGFCASSGLVCSQINAFCSRRGKKKSQKLPKPEWIIFNHNPKFQPWSTVRLYGVLSISWLTCAREDAETLVINGSR